MKHIATTAATILALLLGASTAEAKTYKGYWDGDPQWRSTIDFLDGNRITYCFQNECHTAKYSGSDKGTARFNWGQARFTIKWNGKSYDATRTGPGFRNTGFFK